MASQERPYMVSLRRGLRTDDSFCRIQVGTRFKYVTIRPGALDDAALQRLWLHFRDILPALPYDDNTWNQAHITRDAASGELRAALLWSDVAGFRHEWHTVRFNASDLAQFGAASHLLQVCFAHPPGTAPQIRGMPTKTMVAKMARFEIVDIEHETDVNGRLQGTTGTAPRFLAHSYDEEGRIMGFFLEQVPDEPDIDIIADRQEEAVSRLHAMGLLSGNCNRYHYLVGSRADGYKVALVNFTLGRPGVTMAELEAETTSIEAMLSAETDSGGSSESTTDEGEDMEDA